MSNTPALHELPETVTAEQISPILQVSAETVRRMAKRGQFPRPIRVATLLRWRRRDVEAFLANGLPA